MNIEGVLPSTWSVFAGLPLFQYDSIKNKVFKCRLSGLKPHWVVALKKGWLK